MSPHRTHARYRRAGKPARQSAARVDADCRRWGNFTRSNPSATRSKESREHEFTRHSTRAQKRTTDLHLGLSVARHLSPERIFILSFAAVILAGAVLLWLPVLAAQNPLPWIDALFQSASAVCVTGLATIDVGRDLSRGGQVVLIALFQVGGLGILTFSTIFFMLLGRSLASKEQDIIQSAFLYAPAPGPGVRAQVRDSSRP